MMSIIDIIYAFDCLGKQRLRSGDDEGDKGYMEGKRIIRAGLLSTV